MKRAATFATGLAVTFFASIGFAGHDQETTYRNLIDQKIAICQMKAQREDSEGKNVRAAAEKADKQAKFYIANKDDLVQQLVQQNVSAKPYKVNCFLIKAYNGEHPADM